MNKDIKTKIDVKNLNLFYGSNQALFDIDVNLYQNKITALIGPSGCGKSTFLRCINRMNDLIPIVKIDGKIIIDKKNIYDKDVDEVSVRKRVGMVFQQPNPFPKSIYDNVAYAPLKHGMVKKGKECDELVETSLIKAGLWNEVKDKLTTPGTSLSGGQQQRLCIARTIAIKPEIILMDEPTSALDPISTEKIEALMLELKQDYTIITVTHNMQQAARVADYTAFFHLGKLIKSEVEKLGLDVVEALEVCLKALNERKIENLKNVEVSEKKFLVKSNEIDNLIITTLALYTPEARDLRRMVAFLKITNEIVRTAANTKDFAKMFRRSYSEELNTNTILEYTIPLLKSALLSTKTAISIIDEQEHSKVEEKYQRVIVEESKTDDLYLMIEKNILKLITQKLDLSKEYFDLLSSLRRLEKIADRSVSIASLLQFAKLGGDIVQS